MNRVQGGLLNSTISTYFQLTKQEEAWKIPLLEVKLIFIIIEVPVSAFNQPRV